MSEFRMSKSTKEHYTSLRDLRAAFGFSPLSKQTSDKEKLAAQREKFRGHYLCKSCKQPMEYVGGNTMACTCETCKGIKHENKNETTGETRVYYTPSFRLLDEKSTNIADSLFN